MVQAIFLGIGRGRSAAAAAMVLAAVTLPAAESGVETTCRRAAAVLAGAASEQEITLSLERSPVGESAWRWKAANGAEGGCRAAGSQLVEVTMTTSAEASKAYTLTCESDDKRRQKCPMTAPGTVRIDRQLSRAPCDEGRTWGVWGDSIWVDEGCRAVFEVRPFGAAAVPAFTVRCESDRQRRKECPLETAGSVRLEEQLSRTECIEGRTWGLTDNGIWVDEGCRAVFAVFPYGPGGGRLRGSDDPGPGDPRARDPDPKDGTDRGGEAGVACRKAVEATGKAVIAVLSTKPEPGGRVYRVVVQAAHLGRLQEFECRWDAATGRTELD